MVEIERFAKLMTVFGEFGEQGHGYEFVQRLMNIIKLPYFHGDIDTHEAELFC